MTIKQLISRAWFDLASDTTIFATRQRSWTLDEIKKPLHVETGYIRVSNPTTVEMVISQPTGIIEILMLEPVDVMFVRPKLI